MKRKGKVTQDEISAALQRFIKDGGVIHHLPDQEYSEAKTVGDDKYQAYESLSNLSALTNTNDSQ